MSIPLIIKGALYKSGDTILRAHMTGEYWMVDCTEFKTKENIKSEYDKNFAKELLNGFYIVVDSVKYYQCDYGPYHTKDFVTLSDLSELEFYDDNNEFTT